MAFLTDNSGVGVAYQIPRNSLALLMISQVVVILPLAIYISPWIVAVWLFCGYWRAQVYRGRWGYPASWVKTILVIGAVMALALSGYRSFSLEAATSLLVLAFSLKLLEMKNRRDAYLLIYLSYFLVATAFLFDQSMAMTAYEIFATVVITAAMVGMNQLQSRVRPLASLWVAAGLIFQAIPLMLVLFLLFPRIAPLWSIPLPSAASTGISDHLTPGDVANLAQSDALAFRVVFDDEIPAQRDLYWRGLVYSEFRFGTWSLATPLDPLPDPNPNLQAVGLSYEVFLEPTQSKWLFSMDTPVAYAGRMNLLADYRLVNPEPILSVTRYRVTSDDRCTMDAELDEEIRLRETALPVNDNPRMHAYAEDLYARTGSAQAMAEAMLAQIRAEPYGYTLKPPRLSKLSSVDEFWFETQLGFCTHYAGAFVYAMRAAGIPARVIGGYQGGEINPVSRHLVVRQYQAHAWAEVWLPGKGWTRYDPTGAVAPERVERGLNAALSSEDRATLSFMTNARMGQSGLVMDMLQWADSLEYRWNLWVVGYDADTQSEVLKDLLGKVTPTRIGMALLVGGGLSVALVTLAVFWRRRPKQRHRVERLFSRFCQAMARHGLARSAQETPSLYVTRLAALAQIDAASLARRLQAHLYNPDLHLSVQDLRGLRQDLRKLRFKLAFTSVGIAS
jgi:transglutaminase-like putative cysteine protease